MTMENLNIQLSNRGKVIFFNFQTDDFILRTIDSEKWHLLNMVRKSVDDSTKDWGRYIGLQWQFNNFHFYLT